VICNDAASATSELQLMLSGKFGAAGNKVVIEQFLHGIELTVIILTDGDSYMILPPSKDYKRIGDGDTGLNTGGMGAVSPPPFATDAFMDKVKNKIIEPTLKGLKKENLRDNMTNTELILNMLAEASTKDISAATNPETFEASKKVAKQGGNVAKVALKELEAKTGKKVVSSTNAKKILPQTKGKIVSPKKNKLQ